MFFRKRPRTGAEQPRDPEALATLRAHNVTVRDETGKTLLDKITVELTSPTTAVLGLNGSGKSTFLGLFNGLTTPSEGTVTVGGVNALDPGVREKVGMIFSDPGAQLIMPTVIEDIELSLRRLKLSRRARLERAREILDARGLSQQENQSVFSLSGGEKQLVALSSVLAVEPQVLLFDEPTTLLDLRNRMRFMQLFNTLTQQLVISTHDLELAAYCWEALIIAGGRIIESGPATAVIQNYRRYCTEGFPGEQETATGNAIEKKK